MPTRTGIPQSFGLLLIFTLLLAGIGAIVGFAIVKSADRETIEAKVLAQEAALQNWNTGLFCVEHGHQDDPALARMAVPPQPCSSHGDDGDDECHGLCPPEPDEDELRATANPARGAELYTANGCQICHGDMGQGIVGPTIAQTGLTIEAAIKQFVQPRGLMPVYRPEHLTWEETADIWAWLQTLPAVNPLIDPNNDALGHENYGQWAQ